jgi:hypothetical protein
VHGYQGRFCTVAVDRAPQDTTYVIAHHDDRESLSRLAALYPQSRVLPAGTLHYGEPYFSTVRVPAETAPEIAPQQVSEAQWRAPEATLQLWGYDLNKAEYKPGDQVGLTAYWRTAGSPALDYTVFVQLLGPENTATGGPLWTQDDSEPCRKGYPTSAWSEHETIIDHFALTVPENAPAGTYQIVVGFYEWQTMQRLPVLDDAGQVVGDHVLLASLQVEAAP